LAGRRNSSGNPVQQHCADDTRHQERIAAYRGNSLRQHEPGRINKSKKLESRYVLRNKLESWLPGGKAASTVSAIVYTVGIERNRPVIAVACRHVYGDGVQISAEERLCRMVYSVLFQLLYQIGDNTVLLLDTGDSFGNFNASIASMLMALKMIRNLLSLIPRCVVIVDGWHFITEWSDDNKFIIEECLRDFMALFGDLSGGSRDFEGGRLLLTTPGSLTVLRDIGTEIVDNLSVTQHIDKGQNRLSILLEGIEW